VESVGPTPIGRRRWQAALAIGAMALAGCAPRPLLERAIHARGGPVQSVIRAAEADVEAGFPGAWQWQTAFLAPDRYAWSIVTATGVDHYLFDGSTVRAFIAGRQVATDTAPGAPLRTQARFVAVTNLDTVAGAAAVTALPRDELPPGVAAGLAVELRDDGARYRLGFDDRGLLVWATGPVDMSQIGSGELTARYDDFRRIGGLWLPFRTTYELGSRRLAVERTLRLCPNDPALTSASFETPERLPSCDPGRGGTQSSSSGSSSKSTRTFHSAASQSSSDDSQESTASSIAVSSAVP
jgi:hypothetical protein